MAVTLALPCGIKMLIFNPFLCYNWLFFSFLANKAMLSDSKARWGYLGSGTHWKLLVQLCLNLLHPKTRGCVFYKNSQGL